MASTRCEVCGCGGIDGDGGRRSWSGGGKGSADEGLIDGSEEAKGLTNGTSDGSGETRPQERKGWLRASWTTTSATTNEDDDDATIDNIATTSGVKREDKKRAQLRGAGKTWIAVLACTIVIPATIGRMMGETSTREMIGETSTRMMETEETAKTVWLEIDEMEKTTRMASKTEDEGDGYDG